MTRKADRRSRGYFGIGVERPKTPANIGTLWRSATCFDASFIFTIGRRFPEQSSDTTKTWRHIPKMEYRDVQAEPRINLHDVATDCLRLLAQAPVFGAEQIHGALRM